jgi:hypothetical protein
MKNSSVMAALLAGVVALAVYAGASTESHEHSQHAHQTSDNVADAREQVEFPTALREHELANMRDHLLSLQQIQEALAKGGFDKAADIAESRLGMNSLKLHGAHEVAPYMPRGMQELGEAMHRSASRFALAATDASATGDVRPALAALSQLTQQCVACHAAYRLR